MSSSTKAPVTPAHTDQAIQAWNLVAAGAGIESLAQSFADLEATVEARVRETLVDDRYAVAVPNLLIKAWDEGLAAGVEYERETERDIMCEAPVNPYRARFTSSTSLPETAGEKDDSNG
jgi:hypothetical protein